MKPILITNSDITVVESSQAPSQPARLQSERTLSTWGDYFDYYMIEEYKGDSFAGYIGHKLTGAAFVFGSVMASPLLATGCTAEMDTVEPFTAIKDGGTKDTSFNEGLFADAETAPDTASTNDVDMSQPDDGITLIDAVQQDSATDTNDVEIANEDAGADGATDAAAPLDGDAAVVDVEVEIKDSGLDDGPVGTDVLLDADTNGKTDVTPPPTDGDTEIKDAVDTGTDVDAALDEGTAEADGVTDTIVPPPDSDAVIDQSTDDGIDIIDAGADDGAAEADICTGKPMCTAGPGAIVKKDDKNGKEYIEVVVKEGETANVSFLMSGTNYDCMNPTLPAAELPGSATPVTVPYSVNQSSTFDETCTVYLCGSSISNPCPPVKVFVTPNQKPVIGKWQTPLTGLMATGDGQFINANNVITAWEANDPDKDPMICKATYSQNEKTVATASAPKDFGPMISAGLAAGSLTPLTDYALTRTCTDPLGAATTAGPDLATTSDYKLIGRWRFNEGVGSTSADYSGLGNIATVSAKWMIDPSNGSKVMSFDGVKGVASIPPSPSLLSLQSEMTVALWLKPQGLPSSTFISQHLDPSPGWFFVQYDDGSLRFIVFTNPPGGSAIYQTDPKVIKPDAWNHVAATYSGTSMVVYVNGEPVPGKIILDGPYSTIKNANIPLVIGGASWSNAVYKGSIDNVMLYSRALTKNEVKALMPVAE